jgi:hypothetical protein
MSDYPDLNPFNFICIFCRSSCEMFLMYAFIAVFNSLSLFHEISQYVYELHYVEVQGVSGNVSADFYCTKSV